MSQLQYRRPRYKLREAGKAYLYLLPMLAFAVLFVYYPFVRTIRYSFSLVNQAGEIIGFAGLENYTYVFGKRAFTSALSSTLLLAAMNVPLTIIITLLAARLCLRRRRLSSVFETMYALPMAISMSAASLIFRVMLNPSVGIVNHALNLSLRWFDDRNVAIYGFLSLTVWMGIGFNFLLFLSALSGISSDLTDSAKLDGAGALRIFFRIQLPLIRPTLLYVVCTNTVQAMLTSGPIMVLFNGGHTKPPVTTLIYYMYTSGYGSSDYSLAAVVSIVTFGVTLLFTITAFAIDMKRGDDR